MVNTVWYGYHRYWYLLDKHKIFGLKRVSLSTGMRRPIKNKSVSILFLSRNFGLFQAKDLHPEGETEMILLAERFQKRFPSLLSRLTFVQ